MKRVLLLALFFFSAGKVACGDLIFDHTQTATLTASSNVPNFVDATGGIASIVAIPVSGHYDLNKVGFLFGTQDLFGSINGGSLDQIGSWRVTFYNDLSTFQADSFGLGGLAQTVDFAAPSNVGWQNVVGTVDGYNLRYVEFGVNFSSTPGSFISAFAVTDSPFTRVGIPYSLGGTGTIGTDPSWIASNLINGGIVSSLPDLGAPFSYGAFRVEGVTAVPEPSSAILGSLALIGFASRYRKRKTIVCK